MLTIRPEQKEALLKAVIAEESKRSFYKFFCNFWDTVEQSPLVLNWHIRFLCKELQMVAERVFRGQPKKYDLIINVSPGSTKSSICSVMFPAWVWTRFPQARFICSSYAYPLSMMLSVKSRDVIASKKYKECFPDVSVRVDKNAKGYFGLTKGGDRFCTSTMGSVTGFHGHFLVVDDPLDPRGVRSDVELRECNNWIGTTLSSRKVDKKVTPLILIMQRLGVGDATDYLLSLQSVEKPVRHICLPCDNSWEIWPESLKKLYDEAGGLMDPNRLSKSVLASYKIDLGPREYAGQFGQAPRAAEGNMFSREKFKIVTAPPAKVIKKVRYWDKAATEGGMGSQSAGVLLGFMENKQWIVLDCIAGRWESVKRESIIKNTAIIDGIDTEVVFEQEGGSGGKESAEATFKNLAGFKRKMDRVTGDKTIRAEPWSVEVNNDNVYLLRGEWNLPYITEHEDFPQGKIKDRVDASSGAYNHLAKLTGKKHKKGGGW